VYVSVFNAVAEFILFFSLIIALYQKEQQFKTNTTLNVHSYSVKSKAECSAIILSFFQKARFNIRHL